MVAVVAGHICMDLTPALAGAPCVEPGTLTEVGALALDPGGSVANTGLALAQLGVPVRLAADAGDDELGEVLRARLGAEAADGSGVRTVPGASTSYSVVVQPPDADRTFWHHVGANATFDGSAVDLDGAGILHIGYPTILPALASMGGTALVALLERARAAGATTSVDLATADPTSEAARNDWGAILGRALPHTDLFCPSIDDLSSVGLGPADPSREAIAALGDRLLDLGPAVVVLKAGSDGLYLHTAGADRLRAGGRLLAEQAEEWSDLRCWSESLAVEVLGTTGAGDAAAAGLLCGLITRMGPVATIELASAAAALRISTRAPLPTATEVARIGAGLRTRATDVRTERHRALADTRGDR